MPTSVVPCRPNPDNVIRLLKGSLARDSPNNQPIRRSACRIHANSYLLDIIYKPKAFDNSPRVGAEGGYPGI